MSDLQIDDREQERRRAKRTLSLLVAAVLGVAAGVVSLLVIVMFVGGDTSPQITRKDFEEAERRWRENGPDNYDIQITTYGRQAAVYRATVRNGTPQSLERNGVSLSRGSALHTWSVPGMFDTIESDFATIERHEDGRPGTPRLTLRATFHARLGYPQQYWRIEWGSDMEIRWEVTEFTAREAE